MKRAVAASQGKAVRLWQPAPGVLETGAGVEGWAGRICLLSRRQEVGLAWVQTGCRFPRNVSQVGML